MNTPDQTELTDTEILNVYKDLYWSGMIGSTVISERVPIARAILAAAREKAAPPQDGADGAVGVAP